MAIKRWERFGRWFRRYAHFDAALSAVGYGKWIATSLSGVVAAVMGVLSDLPAIVVLALVLFVMVAVLWLWIGVTFKRDQTMIREALLGDRPLRTPDRPLATEEELSGSYIQGRTVHLADLVTAESPIIRHKTFVQCTIEGPAVLVPLGPSVIEGSSWSGTPESILIEIGGDAIVGAIGLDNCTIRDCVMKTVGLVGPPDVMEKWRKGFGLE